MNIVVPLAGKDQRFESRGVCKPLININGKPLIKHCIDTLDWPFKQEKYSLHFLVLKEHDLKYGLPSKLEELFQESKVHVLKEPTDGAARTVLAIEDEIRGNEELIVYLADIHFSGDIKTAMKQKDAGGVLPVFKSSNPKYSYAIADSDGRVSKVAEKKVISDNASAGFYYYRKGDSFISAAKEMIQKEDRVNNAFYICPTYNYLLGEKVLIAPVEFVADFGAEEFIKRWLG
ncbi:MAG: sugar phosphate nucleotidyltransferase [Candidatus Micrarchaeota archaeon]